MEVRIGEVPPGDAPEHVRRAWVGLVLPLAAGETGPREAAPVAGVLGRLRQLVVGREPHYVVPAEAALAILGRDAPAAAAWWRAAAPELASPGQTIQFPAGVCDKLVRLPVGSREVVVGTRPLRAIKANFQTTRLRRQGDDRLVLTPTGFRYFSLIWLCFGTMLIGESVYWAVGGELPAGVLVGCFLTGGGLVALGLGLWAFPGRYEFDRTAGMMRASRSDPRERPLSDVLAVQLVRHPSGSEKDGPTYQLNLVLDDERQQRLCLSNHTSWDATRAAGAELARFLGVPLLDDVSGAGSG